MGVNFIATQKKNIWKKLKQQKTYLFELVLEFALKHLFSSETNRTNSHKPHCWLVNFSRKSWDSLQRLLGTLIEVYLPTIATADRHDVDVIEGSLFWHKLASLHNPSDKPPCPQSSPRISHPLEGHQPFWPPPGSLIPSVLPNVKW